MLHGLHLPFQQVTRLREYQGVDPHFDNIARQYHDIVMVIMSCKTAIHFHHPLC